MTMINNVIAHEYVLQDTNNIYVGRHVLQIKDFCNMENIYIAKSKLLSHEYLSNEYSGLDEACEKWILNQRQLKKFFSISKAYETGTIAYRVFDQIPCVIDGSFVLYNEQYHFEIQVGGSFEMWNKSDERFYFGCDSNENTQCDAFLP